MLVSVKPVVDLLETLGVRVGPLVQGHGGTAKCREVPPYPGSPAAERDVALRLP